MRAHGTYACYKFGPLPGDDTSKGCRCDECREAVRVYARQNRQRVEPAYVGADEVRQHVRFLSENGVGLKQISKQAGVSHGALWKLMYGKGGKPSKRVRKETRDRILMVQPSHGAAGSRVPAGPTWDVIDRLLARGWSKLAIAQAIGQSGPGLQLGREVVTRRNAEAVRSLLDQPVPERHGKWRTVVARMLEEQPPELEPERELDDIDRLYLDLAEVLEQRIDARAWRSRAACTVRNVPAWVFFPSRGDVAAVEAARRVCATCPVRDDCLAEALSMGGHDDLGIRAGLSARERRRLRTTEESAA